MSKKIKSILKLVCAIVVAQLAGIIGAFFTTPAIDGWYAGLVKPALNPPAWVFGPVWTTLFVLMGVSAWLVWRKLENHPWWMIWSKGNGRQIKIALGIFLGQLVLNTLWSIIFFGWHNPGLAFAEVILLWLAIIATIVAFKRVSKTAAWLLAPYLVWVSFAAYLNLSLWLLN